ncbi:Uma2 family endonuclease [Sphingomonas metalli]|nr:Uma2 family endonuclease [Sphingomonas metalli]
MEELVSFAEPRPVKLTVDDFAVLHRAGALDHVRRAELIEGVITEMSPLRSRHAVLTSRLMVRGTAALEAIGSPLMMVTTPTITLPPHNAPEPDLVIARIAEDDFYIDGKDVALVIEVSFATLRFDLTTKRDLYAQGGIPELWVVDGEAGRVHQFWRPIDGAYREMREFSLQDELRSATLPNLAIDGAGIG